jgi:4-amino-4-deoxychorismate lyase
MTDSGRGGALVPETVLINGRASREVSVLERGLHYGDGLFETIACLNGRPRFLDLHLKRLAAGCARLGLPADLAAVAREVRELAAPAARAVIKVLVTRGAAIARGYALTGGEETTRITLRYAGAEQDLSAFRQGVRVRIATVRLGENPALAGLKHCNRLEQVLARREWSDPDIAEALMFSSAGALISGTMTNVFLVQDGALHTPRVDRCGVAGIMRELVLTGAAAAGIPAQERLLGAADLEQAQELFLTNALSGVLPVRELGSRVLAAGPLTRRLQEHLAPSLANAELPAGGAGE